MRPHLKSEAMPVHGRSRRQLLAAGLAAASALVGLLATLALSVPVPASDASLSELVGRFDYEAVGRLAAKIPGLLMAVGVPAVGAWLAIRRDALRSALGLVAVATWAAMALPATLRTLRALTVGSVHPGLAFGAVANGLAVAALVAAGLALAARPARYPLKAAGPRKTAAFGVAVWGLAGTASFVLLRVTGPDFVGWSAAVVAESLVQLLVLLAAAAVVGRRDSVLVIAVVLVIIVQAVVTAAGAVRTMTADGEAFWGIPGVRFTVAGVDVATVEAALTVAAAAVIAAASPPLLMAARRAWRFL